MTVNISASQLASVMASASNLFHKISEDKVITRKSDGSLVTNIDHAINDALRASLRELLPIAGWWSEEDDGSQSHVPGRWVWVVDPIDGTMEFIRDVPEFAISVALLDNGCAVAGGVINPSNGVGAFSGTDGSFYKTSAAATLNPREHKSTTSIDCAVSSVSRSETEKQLVTPFLCLVGATRPVGSVAYKLLRVALGVEDMTFSVQPKSAWDICGGIALLNAVGLRFHRFDGRDNIFTRRNGRLLSGFVAGSNILVDEFYERLRKSELREQIQGLVFV